MTHLKPCPFCGSTRILGMTLQCPKCSAIGPRATSQPEAVELWNRRASGWISVAQRLPSSEESVLAVQQFVMSSFVEGFRGVRFVTIARFDGVDQWLGLDGSAIVVVAWQPLPALPEELK